MVQYYIDQTQIYLRPLLGPDREIEKINPKLWEAVCLLILTEVLHLMNIHKKSEGSLFSVALCFASMRIILSP